MPKVKVRWSDEVGADDANAARTYLSLLFSPQRARTLDTKLRECETQAFPAKDVLRASGLKLLGKDDEVVAGQLKKIKAGEELSAILLVRLEDQGRLIVADGFHRLCAVMLLDEKEAVRCRIV